MGEGLAKESWFNQLPVAGVAAVLVPLLFQVTVNVTSLRSVVPSPSVSILAVVRVSVIVELLTSPQAVIALSNWLSMVTATLLAAAGRLAQLVSRSFSVSWLMIWAARVWRSSAA